MRPRGQRRPRGLYLWKSGLVNSGKKGMVVFRSCFFTEEVFVAARLNIIEAILGTQL